MDCDTVRTVRCAIYTRKSTEEGLEQRFNTLQAQRESAEAYIASQRQSGWIALDDVYEDGGYSGASMERPGLQRLLAHVEARRVNCVVVYKVDRLSRSLLDFARLMALFERHGVSFVSVTQEFNTTTSLGRLTLNILLSFAQFEREIISERTRDKLSAARRKGKWIGGIPVLGYDVGPQGGGLLVNEPEAAQVATIFQIAEQAGTLEATLAEVQRIGIKTKQWTSAGGRRHEGRSFSKSSLRRLLGNVVYKGVISHKGAIWPGEQPAIVETSLWEQVNARLEENARHQTGRRHQRRSALLKGLVYCGVCGSEMVPSETRRRGRTHRYYICPGARPKQRTCAQARPLAAADAETRILREMGLTTAEASMGRVLQDSLDRLVWAGQSRQLTIEYRDGTRRQIVLEGVRAEPMDGAKGRIPRITRLLALAIKLDSERAAGRFRDWAEMARLGQTSRARLSQISSLLNLAPDIQEMLLFLPKTMKGADVLNEKRMRHVARAADWDEQRNRFKALTGIQLEAPRIQL